MAVLPSCRTRQCWLRTRFLPAYLLPFIAASSGSRGGSGSVWGWGAAAAGVDERMVGAPTLIRCPFRHGSGHGGADPVGSSAGWSGKGGALLTTRPHQVDRRQQVSGETDDDQQYGDSEREGELAGRATSRRVQGGNVPRTSSWRGQCGREAEEKSHQAGERHEGGDQLVAPAPCRGGPQDQHPGDPAQPARDWAEDDQPRRPRVPATAARGRCACPGGDGSGVADIVEEGPDTRCVAGIEPGPPLVDVPVHFGEDLLPPGCVDVPQRCVQLRQIAPDELAGLPGGLPGSHSWLPSLRISSTASRKTRHCSLKLVRASSPSLVRW